MSTEIKCPNCAHTFPIEEVMAEEYKKDLREKMVSFTKQKEERKRNSQRNKMSLPFSKSKGKPHLSSSKNSRPWLMSKSLRKRKNICKLLLRKACVKALQ
jgi:hypothetical protein